MTPEHNPHTYRGMRRTAQKFPRSSIGVGASPANFDPANIRLVVGLGNPGARYARTYHNAGRIAVLLLTDASSSPFSSRCRFLLPNTFMNESGSAVKRALRAKPATLLLVHDDADLPLGRYRLSFARGAAGHHGVESVIRALGTKEFWRLRIGVRPPAMKGKKADAFVLHTMTRSEEKMIKTAIEEFLAAQCQTPTPSGEEAP